MVDLIPNLAVFRPLRRLREAAEREQSEQKDGPGRFFILILGYIGRKRRDSTDNTGVILRNRVFIIDLVSRLNPFCIHRQPEPGTIGYVFRAAPDSCVHFQKPKC